MALKDSYRPGAQLRLSALAVGLIVLLAGSPDVASAAGGKTRGKLVAQKHLTAADGGFVRARNGASLYVPPGVMTADGRATIRRVRTHVYDFHIAAPWTGRVAVTLPARGRRLVAHRIGATWVRESQTRRERTVWVTSLSLFSWVDKVRASVCFKKRWKEIAACLAQKGVEKISVEVVRWLAERAGVSNECVTALVTSKGFVGQIITILASEACRGRAGETQEEIDAWKRKEAEQQAAAQQQQEAAAQQQQQQQPPTQQQAPQQQQPPTQQQAPQQQAPQPPGQKGFTIQDDVYGGTWARTDPNDGTWHSSQSRPANAKHWFRNGLGVAVDCARSAAAYRVKINGRNETWTWWAHVTDDTWVPVAVFSSVWNDGNPGVATC